MRVARPFLLAAAVLAAWQAAAAPLDGARRSP